MIYFFDHGTVGIVSPGGFWDGRWPSASGHAPVADGENLTGHLAVSEDIHRQLAKIRKILILYAMVIWTCLPDSIVNYDDTEA